MCTKRNRNFFCTNLVIYNHIITFLFIFLKVRQLIDHTQQQSEALREILSSKYHEREEVHVDQRLAMWLQGLGLHESTQKIFLSEGFTLDEVLYEISRDDLHRVGLKGASEFRIWRAIQQHRNRASPLCNGTLSDETGTI